MSDRNQHIGSPLDNLLIDEKIIEMDPANLDSTTIKYLNYENLSKAELIMCIEQLLDEIKVLEDFIDGPYEIFDEIPF